MQYSTYVSCKPSRVVSHLTMALSLEACVISLFHAAVLYDFCNCLAIDSALYVLCVVTFSIYVQCVLVEAVFV